MHGLVSAEGRRPSVGRGAARGDLGNETISATVVMRHDDDAVMTTMTHAQLSYALFVYACCLHPPNYDHPLYSTFQSHIRGACVILSGPSFLCQLYPELLRDTNKCVPEMLKLLL